MPKMMPLQPASQNISAIPLWLKISYTLFVAILVPAYWKQHGPINFLWGSDIALIITLFGLWLESSLLVSMMALAVLIPELGWTVDFIIRIVAGPEISDFRGTRYMFDPDIPFYVRCLSLFHVVMPALLLWSIHRLGYHRRALISQTLLCWIIYPLSYLMSDPAANINWVYGFGSEPQRWLSGPVYVLFLMALFPLALYLPTHLLLYRPFVKNKFE